MGSRSKSNTATTSSFYDNRSVVDAGGGIVGTGNSWDQSTTLIDGRQTYTDASDRSQTYTDSRDLSQRFTDLSDRSVSISTDGGAFGVVESIGLAQADLAREIAAGGAGTSSAAVQLARESQQAAAGFNERAAGRSFDLAESSQARAFDASGEALGFARETFADVLGLARNVVGQAGSQAEAAASTAAGAYSSAADTASGNKTLIYAALAAVAAVGLAVAFKR